MIKHISITRSDCPCTSSQQTSDHKLLDVTSLDGLFGGPFNTDGIFILAVSPKIGSDFKLVSGSRPVIKFNWAGPESRSGLLKLIADADNQKIPCRVLWIGEDEFEHFKPNELKTARLGAVSFFSTAYTPVALSRYFDIVSRTDYQGQLQLEQKFLGLLDTAEVVEFRSQRFGTLATFRHQLARHWFSMHGPLNDGEQIVLPTGELAVLADPSGELTAECLAVDGEVVLWGAPIVHRGDRSVSQGDTAATYASLRTMGEWPVIVKVQHGMIVEVRSPVSGSNPFAEELKELFVEDQRYRKIQEIGFGTNAMCDQLTPANDFPNERYPGVHFGLGLGGHTRFHLDLVCPDTQVLARGASEAIDVYSHVGLVRCPI